MKYEIGDKVVCIGMNEDYNDKIPIGKVMTIADISTALAEPGDWYRFKDWPNRFHSKYFCI